MERFRFGHGIADAFRTAGYYDEQFNVLLDHTKATTIGIYGNVPQGVLSQRVGMIEAVAFPGLDTAFFRRTRSWFLRMRDQIVREIQRLAEQQGGRAPGINAFAKETGIGEHIWRGKFWARWSDALAEAGFVANEFQARLETELVLSKLAEVTRHYKRVPTTDEIGLYRRMNPAFPSAKTFRAHFKRAEMLEQLRNWVSEKSDYEDVLAMLPAKARGDRTSFPTKPTDGFVYLIRSGAHYKIGRSDELERRVKEIRVALPDSATLEHSIRTDDPSGIEAYWHRRFGDKRANGEWFKLDRADVAAFKRRKFQ